MLTTSYKPPHPEYSSSGATSNTGSQVPSAPAAKSNNFDISQLTDRDDAPLPEERSFVKGMAFDFLKNFAKIMTGSLLTDVLKGTLQDKNQTPQEIIYKNLMDSFFSRISTDTLNSWAVRLFSGNHKFLGIKIPYIMPEFSSQILAMPSVLGWRSATKDFNVNAKAARNNENSEKEEAIKEAIQTNQPAFLRWADTLSKSFKTHLKPHAEKFFSKFFGIYPGDIQKDSEGNTVFEKDKEGNIKTDKDGKPKPLYSNQKLNTTRLTSMMAGTYALSAFLPKHTAAFGFEKARSVKRGLFATGTTSLFRLLTTLLHNGVGAHIEGGKNFDECFRLSVVAKMLVPLTQYFCDFLGSYTAKFLPGNGAFLAMTYRLLAEMPATFLSTGVLNIAKKDRVPEEWKYLGYKIWKPAANTIETVLKPFYRPIGKLIGRGIGMFDPRIKNMYAGDIRSEDAKAKDLPDPDFMAKHENSGLSVIGLLGKKLLEFPMDIASLVKEAMNDSKVFDEKIQQQVQKVNQAVDNKNEAKAILEELGINSNIELDRDQTREINRRVIYLAEEGRQPEIQELVESDKNNVIQIEQALKTKRKSLQQKIDHDPIMVQKNEQTEAA